MDKKLEITTRRTLGREVVPEVWRKRPTSSGAGGSASATAASLSGGGTSGAAAPALRDVTCSTGSSVEPADGTRTANERHGTSCAASAAALPAGPTRRSVAPASSI